MNETVLVQFREEISHELCSCSYEDIPPEYEDEIDSETYRRYNDWQQDQENRLSEGREDRDNMAQADLNKRLGI